MRLFAAIDLNNELREECRKVTQALQLSGADLKVVVPENLHITLKFFGEVREDCVKEVSDTLRKMSESMHPFSMGLSVLGYFGGVRFPRTIWIGISEGRGTISSMMHDLDENLSHIRDESRKNRPHLTLARVKSVRNTENLIETIKSMRDVKLGELCVNKLTLKKSDLNPDGPTYSNLETFELGSRGSES